MNFVVLDTDVASAIGVPAPQLICGNTGAGQQGVSARE